MTISAKIIADSTALKARRLTTFELRYPRFIHAEFLTHRQFSRNASSSRAIPVERQIAAIKEDTAMPIHWGKNQAGMQADGEHDADVVIRRHLNGSDKDGTLITDDPVNISMPPQAAWLEARDNAIAVAEAFLKAGYHKQVVNRLLEPFSHITVVCTSTQYDNFFALRRHPDAQPEIKALADAMHEAMAGSTPTELSKGEWHLPYVTEDDKKNIMQLPQAGDEDSPIDPATQTMIAVSVARCARVSYKTHDGKASDLWADLKLYDRLIGGVPLHASPAEHQATPDSLIWNSADLAEWENPHLHGNLSGGWRQFRKFLPEECIDNWDDPLDVF